MTGKIDKSALRFGEPERVRDPEYRQSARGRPCDVMGCHGDPATVVGAHIRITSPDHPGAAGSKPHDGLLAMLCYGCHEIFDRRKPVTRDQMIDLLSRLVAGLALQRYRAWKQGR